MNDFPDTREEALAATTIPWIADYPDFYIAWTGGSCRAWRHDLDPDTGSYLLITNEDGTSPEPDEGGTWLCGSYSSEEDVEGTVEELRSSDDVKAFVEAIIGL